MLNLNDMTGPWGEHLRLALLRALADECPDGRGHESLLVDLVNAVFISADREQVRAALLWLHEHQLVAADVVAQALVARITDRGRDVAAGRRKVQGVKEPAATARPLSELLGAVSTLKKG